MFLKLIIAKKKILAVIYTKHVNKYINQVMFVSYEY